MTDANGITYVLSSDKAKMQLDKIAARWPAKSCGAQFIFIKAV